MATATKTSPEREILLSVRNLKKYYPIHKGIFSRVVGNVKAVDDISFDIYPNETVGLVGESGCGKTTAGRTILRLLEPTEGEVVYRGRNVYDLDDKKMRSVRREMQIIFQDPYSSLNPRMTIESIIGEAIEFHGIASGDARRELVENLLERVGLQPSYITRYPHEFSGGQRQRIGIARALALNPSFIVCDEAVSALDVSVQAQVINLLQDLQEEYQLSYLFIAHDLSVVRHISDRIAVMYLGHIMEMAESEELFEDALHPYTQALLSAIPQPNPRRKHTRVILEGDVPSPINPPSGCVFHTRCPACYEPCPTVIPRSVEAQPGHFVKCHLYDPEYAPSDPAIWEKLPNFVEKLAAEQAGASGDAADAKSEDAHLEVVEDAPEAQVTGDQLEGVDGSEDATSADAEASPETGSAPSSPQDDAPSAQEEVVEEEDKHED